MNHTSSAVDTWEQARLVFAWLVVGIPLGWGIWQVVVKSLVLFGVE